jgi:hypothetical protein
MDLNNINDEEENKNEGEPINNNIIKNGNNVPNLLNRNSFNDDQNTDNYDLDIENIDEDLYMQELYLRLAQMKQERKEAENNAKLLDNRLNLLKGEEKKAWKKIESTKMMANNKLQHLQHIVQNNKLKVEAKKQKEKEILLKREQNKKMVEQIKNSTAAKKEKLKRQVEEEAKLLKIQKVYNKQLINFLNEELINQNKSKCACAKSQKSFNQEKKKIMDHQKRMKLREELERKLIEEYKLKEEAETKRSKAEQEELEMIKKLQTTTKIHQNISDELQKMNINSVMRGDYDNEKGKKNMKIFKTSAKKKFLNNE